MLQKKAWLTFLTDSEQQHKSATKRSADTWEVNGYEEAKRARKMLQQGSASKHKTEHPKRIKANGRESSIVVKVEPNDLYGIDHDYGYSDEEYNVQDVPVIPSKALLWEGKRADKKNTVILEDSKSEAFPCKVCLTKYACKAYSDKCLKSHEKHFDLDEEVECRFLQYDFHILIEHSSTRRQFDIGLNRAD